MMTLLLLLLLPSAGHSQQNQMVAKRMNVYGVPVPDACYQLPHACLQASGRKELGAPCMHHLRTSWAAHQQTVCQHALTREFGLLRRNGADCPP